MPGVDRLEEGQRLLAPHLAEDQPVGSHPQRRHQQLRRRPLRGRDALGDQRDAVLVRQVQLASVLDREQALGPIGQRQERSCFRGLAGGRSARDQNAVRT
jgi:hypothetical protein